MKASTPITPSPQGPRKERPGGDRKNIKIEISTVFYIFIFSILSYSAYGQEANTDIKSGYYSGMFPLYLAYDKENQQVSGYVYMNSDDSPDKYVCEFYFIGNYKSEKNISISFSVYDIVNQGHIAKGRLYIISNKEIMIKSESYIPGCQNLLDLIKGENNTLTEYRFYKKISTINIKKQYIYRAPNNDSQTKSYIIQYDPVGVIKEQNEWVFIKYLRNEKIEGWIPKKSIR